MNHAIIENDNMKIITSETCNHYFNKHNGVAMTWGETKEEDPEWCPIGPLILDIEVTTRCNGVPNKNGIKTPCTFCYKSNTSNGKNMSFEIFKKILDKLPKTITQIAIGADSESTSNPDLWKMMEYSRSLGIVPNITTANVSDDVAKQLKKYCGAVAISRYANKDICYDSVKKLTDLGMTQINIHQLSAEETVDMCLETLNDIKTDPRLSKLNAIVFLALKNKGTRNTFTPMNTSDFTNIISRCLNDKINFGFDSCSANKFLTAADTLTTHGKFKELAEPCESTRFSSYINVDGKFFPCSFSEDEEDWIEGLDVVNCNDFIKNIWLHPKTLAFRSKLLECDCNCPLFKI